MADYERGSSRFEQKCAARCLELAARATELEPENVDWWRLRALLLFRDRASRPIVRLATPTGWRLWTNVPGTIQTMHSTITWPPCNSGPTTETSRTTAPLPPDVEVHNVEGFAKGVARFEQGQRKTSLALDQSAYPVTAEFLAARRCPARNRPIWLHERDFGIRVSQVLFDVQRWSEALAGTQDHKGDWAAGLAILRQQQHMNAMSASVPTSPTRRLLVAEVREKTLNGLLRFASRHPDLIADAGASRTEQGVESTHRGRQGIR